MVTLDRIRLTGLLPKPPYCGGFYLVPRRWHHRLVIDRLRAAADALNRGDPEPFAALIAEDCEWRGVPYGRLWWKRTPS